MTDPLVDVTITVHLRVPASTVGAAERAVRTLVTTSPLLAGTVQSAAITGVRNA